MKKVIFLNLIAAFVLLIFTNNLNADLTDYVVTIYVSRTDHINHATAESFPEIYLTNPNTGEQILLEISGLSQIETLAVSPITGALYSVRQGSGSGYGYRLYEIDIISGNTNLIGGVGTSTSTYITDLAFSPNGTLYGVVNNGKLLTIDLETAEPTFINSNINLESILGLAIKDSGQGICSASDGYDWGLYWVNLSNGSTTLIQYIDYDFRVLEYGPDGVLYAWLNDWDNGTINKLYSINTETLIATEVGSFTFGGRGFSFGIPIAYCANRPIADLNRDCRVNIYDFAIMASEWLSCGLEPQNACW